MSDSQLFVGVDVGGTNIKIGIVDDQGGTIAKTKFATMAKQESLASMEKAKTRIDKLLDEAGRSIDDVAAIGLGTPGPLDVKAGMILTPNNLPGWRNDPVREQLSELTGKPVTYANDASAAAFGEYWIGSGRHYESMVLLTLGTGVGGGIIIDDLNIEGAHSHGAEVGHMTIDTALAARLCPCGQLGTSRSLCQRDFCGGTLLRKIIQWSQKFADARDGRGVSAVGVDDFECRRSWR